MTSLKNSLLTKKYSKETIQKAKETLLTLVPSCGRPLYSSIDLRDSGTRLVAVDVNLFPAGFNNLPEEALLAASEEMKAFLKKKLSKDAPWKVGLVPEAHTNNEGYLQNLLTLQSIITRAGAEFRLAWSGLPIPKLWTLKTANIQLSYYPMNEVVEWSDILLLNHDLSGGPLQALESYTKPIYPNPELGWYKRRKSDHFEIARKVLRRISSVVPEINPRDFIADSTSLDNLNLDREEDMTRLLDEARNFYLKLKKEYDEQGVEEAPFVYVKNDSGTYGLGIWKFSSLEELESSRSLLKKRFFKGKQSMRMSRFILQEGISTRMLIEEGKGRLEFEPVIYSVNGNKVGTFFRYGMSSHDDSGQENLNQPGAWFEEHSRFPEDYEHMKCLYDFVACLHSVSAALEDCPCG